MKAFLVSEMNLIGKCLCFKFFTNKDNQCHKCNLSAYLECPQNI